MYAKEEGGKKGLPQKDTTLPDHSFFSRGRTACPTAGSFFPEPSSTRPVCLFPANCVCLLALALGCSLFLATVRPCQCQPSGRRPEIPRLGDLPVQLYLNSAGCPLLPACRRQVLHARPATRQGQTQGQSSDAASLRSAAPCPERQTTIHARPYASYMYGRRPHSLLSCRPESCTSHPCLVPVVGRPLGRDVSRAPAASPGACAQHVRLWQFGHARHERNRGTFLCS